MLLSVILITWNGRKLLSNCLKSMSFLLQREDVEVIVVDNGSEDGTIHFLHDKYPDITAISLDKNRGVAYARNRALERANGEYLWILDNDTELSEPVARGMMQFMKDNPGVGLAGCRLVDADGLLQESCKRYPRSGRKGQEYSTPAWLSLCLWFGKNEKKIRTGVSYRRMSVNKTGCL